MKHLPPILLLIFLALPLIGCAGDSAPATPAASAPPAPPTDEEPVLPEEGP